MKLGDANYDSAVEQKRTELRGHKVTQLTESECKQEIEAIVGERRVVLRVRVEKYLIIQFRRMEKL